MGKSNVAYMKPDEITFPDHFLGGKTYKRADAYIQREFKEIMGL